MYITVNKATFIARKNPNAYIKNNINTEQEKIRQELLVCCKLDTYVIVKNWGKLKKVTGGE